MKRMRLPAVLALVLPFAVVQARPGKDDPKKIQGVWVWTETEKQGKKMNAPADFKLRITPTRIENLSQDDPLGYKLGTDGELGTIDLVPEKGEHAGKTRQCLYELKDDELKICLPDTFGAKRPTEFSS